MTGRSFEFATATRIAFGAGKRTEAAAALKAFGARRVLLVTGADGRRSAPFHAGLESAGLIVVAFRVPGEPTVELAREGTAKARAERCDAVVAIGGGSAIDAGKAIAALAVHGADPFDHLEVIGRGVPLPDASLPFVALPTTAGTGAEVTRNAVLASREAGAKASLRSLAMLPRLAIVDPDLLDGAPKSVLAAAGMDALSQLIEPYVSGRAQPMTDALARDGITRSARSLRRAVLEDADASAREDLALASLFGGLCLANAGLGAVHGFAAPVGGLFDAPHGAVCAALLGPTLAVNARALAARAEGHPSLPRFREIAALLTGAPDATVEDGIAWVEALRHDLRIPGLGHYGLTEAELPRLVERARAASSMKGNPIVLTDDELLAIARGAL